jgi:hypothetical protein
METVLYFIVLRDTKKIIHCFNVNAIADICTASIYTAGSKLETGTRITLIGGREFNVLTPLATIVNLIDNPQPITEQVAKMELHQEPNDPDDRIVPVIGNVKHI